VHSPLLGRGPAECICNLQLQPSHSDPTSLGQGDCRVHLQSGIAAEPPTNAADRPVIAAEILQLQPKFCNCSRNSAIAAERCSAAIPGCKCTLQALRPREGWRSEWLGCNFRLQMHSAVSPPKGFTPTGRAQRKAERSGRGGPGGLPPAPLGRRACIVHSGIAAEPTPRAPRGVRVTSSRRVRVPHRKPNLQTCALQRKFASLVGGGVLG